MKIYRLFAGAGAAALLATSAFAQTGSMSSAPPASTAPASGAMAQPSTPSTGATPPASEAAPMAGGAAAFTPITPSASSNIIAELKASGEFTTLLAAIDGANLTDLLSTHPGITLIAPTDAAFAALPPGQLDAMKKDPAQLQALLTYHLIAAKVSADQVKGHAAGQVMTAAKKNVTIDGSATPIKINDATVLQAAVPASNGAIFVVDKVLTPTG